LIPAFDPSRRGDDAPGQAPLTALKLPVVLLVAWKAGVIGFAGTLVALSLVGLYRRWRSATTVQPPA